MIQTFPVGVRSRVFAATARVTLVLALALALVAAAALTGYHLGASSLTCGA